jgi:hypothetical protein
MRPLEYGKAGTNLAAAPPIVHKAAA